MLRGFLYKQRTPFLYKAFAGKLREIWIGIEVDNGVTTG